ncbi:methionyl-tRNA formyltransferase [bacterium]|nr:methionyl-tRNA formyltransferase [bacterium]
MPFRLAFMGSPDFAVPTLLALIGAGHEIACVYSQPPRPAGRGQAERRTPVHAAAAERGLEVRTPPTLKDPADRAAFAALGLDAAVVVAYGLLLPKPVLDAPRLGCFNLHGSLLPRWRGAAPIQRAVMAGDARTGVQVMQMEAGLDTGPILAAADTPIGPTDTAGSLHDRLAPLGAALIVSTLDALDHGAVQRLVQSEIGVTHAAKITADETGIDWSRPARHVSAHIRGLSPHPGAWFELASDRGPVRFKVLNALVEDLPADGAVSATPGAVLDDRLLIACGEGAVRLTELQRAGKSPMSADALLRGTPIAPGTLL